VYTSGGESFLFDEPQSGWISCTVTDACGNFAVDSTWITVDASGDPLVVQPIADVSVMCGEILNLSVIVEQSNGAFNTSWWSDGQLLSETIELIIDEVTGPMSIEVVVSDECGQEWQQEVNVFFDAGELSLELPESVELACGETVMLEPVIVSDNDTSVPSWYADGAFASQGESYIFDELQSAWISCEVMDLCGNFAIDSTWVSVEPGEMSVSISDTVICSGGTASLQADVIGGTGELMYWWNGNTGDSEEVFFLNESSVIEVMVEDICGLTATDEAEITVLELTPEIGIEELSGGYSLQLLDTCAACSYTWTLPDGSTLSSQILEYYPVSGYDNVILLEVNNGVCYWSGFWHFEPESAIYVPNAFTPDGDGVNDVFSVAATGLDNFECIIFDRWGEIVFRTSDPSFTWMGDVQGGGYYAPDGVYTWVIHAGNGIGESWVKRGSVVLIR
jgi:gliding motility-associated-like protein